MKREKPYYLIAVAVVLLLTVIPAVRRTVATAVLYVSKPISQSISSKAQSSRGIIAGLREISNLHKENNDLTQKLKGLQVDKTELEELRHENQVLKNQLGFSDEHQDSSLLAARIIGREPFGALDRIIIDKGEKDGVKAKSAVVSNGSLVGKVSEVSDNQAKVVLITSKDSIVQAMLQKSRTLGIIKGSLSGVKLENIPQDTVVAEKEAVVTSGLGGEISPGILIGWVRGESSGKSEIYKVLEVDVAEDLNKLEYVFVVKQ